jgi:drug/metabolite transporter (DMT)-like permease
MMMRGGWQVPAAILYTGLVTTAATVYMENIALLHVSAAEMAVILTTEPLFASAIAAVVLHETMGPGSLGGGALILIACLLNQLQNTGVHVPDMLRKKLPSLDRPLLWMKDGHKH